MEPLTIAGVIIAVILAFYAMKFVVGLAKTAIKVAIVLLAVYLVFTFVSDSAIGPTGASVDEPTDSEQGTQPTEEGSQYPPDYTRPDSPNNAALG